MRVLKWLGMTALAIVGIVVVALVWLVTTRPNLSAFESHYAPSAQGDVTVRFFGTTSLLFSDGETDLMIDGWFSRPSTAALFLGQVEPDYSAIENGLSRLGNSKIAALLVTHSHLDHAMDVAEVAKRTGALLVGSASTANIGRGGGLPEHQIKIIQDGETLRFGKFAVTMIASQHFTFPSSSFLAGIEKHVTIEAPLTPPASAFAYRQGVMYSVLIDHPAGRALIQSSPGFKTDSLDGIDVDMAYLGVGFIASQTADYRDAYWREVVTRTQPEGISIMHWDSLSRPIAEMGDRPAPPNRLWNDVLGMRAAASINEVLGRAQTAGVRARLLPMWEAVDAFSVGLPARRASPSDSS